MAERGGSSTAIPGRGDPDRKRALNVLAQRRYREFLRSLRLTLSPRLMLELRTKETGEDTQSSESC